MPIQSLGRPRHRFMDNIKIDLERMEWYGLVDLTWNRDKWRALLKTVL
jgi:hypothetical protein